MRYMERSTVYFTPHTSSTSLRVHQANIHFNREMSREAPKRYSWGFAPIGSTRDDYPIDMCFITAEINEDLINPVIVKGEDHSE